jgi:DNA-binding SARP family transcriptional activator/Tol biopolymer transport system component
MASLIELRVLGSLDLRSPEGNEILSVLSQPKRLCFLAYLAVNHPHGFRTRNDLAHLFWPDLDQDRARAAVRKALHFLRRSLGDETVQSRDQDLVEVDGEKLWCDAAAFQEAVEGEHLEEALELYRGDLLEGVSLSDSPAFDEWLLEERDRLRIMASRAAWTLAHRQVQEGRLGDAERTGQRALGLGGTDEAAVRAFIKSLSEAGDPSAAVRLYEKFAQGLKRDADRDPSPESRNLVDEIRAGSEPLPPAATRQEALTGETEVGLVLPPTPQVPETTRRWALFRRAPLAAAGWGLGVLFALMGGWASWTVFTPDPQPVRWTHLDLGQSVSPTSWIPPPGVDFALSPDGSRILYVGPSDEGWQLWVKEPQELEPRRIPLAENAYYPVFSPDGQSLAYETDRGIRMASLSGGTSSPVAMIPVGQELDGLEPTSRPRMPAWGDDGWIYFARDSVVYRAPARPNQREDELEADSFTLPTESAVHLHPSVLPNGIGLLVTVAHDSARQSKIGVVGSDGGEVEELLEGAMARYLSPGYLVYTTEDGMLWSVPFDLQELQKRGSPVVIADTVEVKRDLASQFTLSASGDLLFRTKPFLPEDPALVWVSPDGKIQPADSTWLAQFELPRLSPDHTRVAASVQTGEYSWEIWVKELNAGGPLKLAEASSPYLSWTADGEWVTYISGNLSRQDVWRIRSDGSGQPELVYDGPFRITDFAWSPNGEWLVYVESKSAGDHGDILAVRPGSATAPIEIAVAPREQSSPTISSDGRRLAYRSGLFGREIHVVPFPNFQGGDWWVEPEPRIGGDPLTWSHDGGRLLFWQDMPEYPRGRDVGLASMPVETGSVLSLRPSRLFFAVTGHRFGTEFDVAPDDSTFLMIRLPDLASEVVLVENLIEVLMERSGG